MTTPDPAQACGVGPSTCPPSPYRTIDGSCNNLRIPALGIPQTTFNRLLPAKYGDGKFIHLPKWFKLFYFWYLIL